METLQINEHRFYRFVAGGLRTNTYVLTAGDEALVVDPFKNPEIPKLLQAENVKNLTVFLTHEHSDHTFGIPQLQRHYKTFLVCQKCCAESIADARSNRPLVTICYLAEFDKKNGTSLKDEFLKTVEEYTCTADKTFDEQMTLAWHGHVFEFRHTPGHSRGSCCIRWNGSAEFVGDSLIFGEKVITRFLGGSTKNYREITKPYLDSLPDSMQILPGHGKLFQMQEVRSCGI